MVVHAFATIWIRRCLGTLSELTELFLPFSALVVNTVLWS
jgi:hypothetical protein